MSDSEITPGPPRTETAYPVTVIIPAYGAAVQLRACIESLIRYLPAGVDVLIADDATPDDTVCAVAQEFADRLPALRYLRQPNNIGFVENCNCAMEPVAATGRDVLLLNSDTEVTEGFLEEMYAVLHLHEKHGVVTPRSNNATIFSVPVYERIDPHAAYDLWVNIRDILPRYQVMPTAVGFCMLIKNAVLRHFGFFDPAYSPGYNEENDFVCRMNRCGYSAVSANRAFVFHFESSSFEFRRKALEQRNRKLLDERYPEYSRKVAEYFSHGMNPVDHFSALWPPHRKRILYDLFHLPAKHSGTSEFALNLLANLSPALENSYELLLGIRDEARKFFESELVGYRFWDEGRSPNTVFDLAFKPCQIFFWEDLYRLTRRAPRICYTHQDLIAARCDYLSGPNLRSIFRISAEIADRVFTISNFSKADFDALYGTVTPFEVIHHGTTEISPSQRPANGYVLVVGNAFHHKAVDEAIRNLAGCDGIVAIGGETRPRSLPSNGRWFPSGNLSRAQIADLYDGCSIVVYPSFYEGFGLPILDALALGRPVVALDNQVNREVRDLTANPNLHLVPAHNQIGKLVAHLLSSDNRVRGSVARTWRDAAVDYARSMTALLEQPVDLSLVRRRWELLGAMAALTPLVQVPVASSDLRGAYLAEHQARLDLLNSYSWKVTAPLRKLYELLRLSRH